MSSEKSVNFESGQSVITKQDLARGCLIYLASTILWMLGAWAGYEGLWPWRHASTQASDVSVDFARRLARWDGKKYQQIAEDGYGYDPEKASLVAFFPAYPITVWGVKTITHWRTEFILLGISHLSLAGALVAFAAYCRHRFQDKTSQVVWITLATLALWPTSCFCRFAYSESLFLFLSTLTFLGMVHRWPLLILGILVGAVTATRPVGAALLVPFGFHIWMRSGGLADRICNLAVFGALATWGLSAYMAFLHGAFADPLAFAHAQEHFRFREPADWTKKLLALCRLEPFWCVFDSASPCYWRTMSPEPNALFNLHLANPILGASSGCLLLLGWWKKWLNAGEIAFAAGALAIPYATRSFEMCTAGMGRFTVVAFPVFMVLGRAFAPLPLGIGLTWLIISAIYLIAFSGLFTAGFPVF